ncbi:hypothetical protein PAP_03325 [Palaeococcus pacificus DY20341]|uniref:FAD/NAD(P)-binding domain-containing protein n=1 Tax=Palaeococcus pacificus DY20341 TaxID=1343739 RepID=A0A075LQV4_9EURY|nr:FAD-dependent oxidoreductase [Palaeococcus pacificus]AIF69085.1 hypothetical protein PAP_03325 [Palaeococcus pacificus DY20341]
MKILVIGNGPAGFTLAKELSKDFDVTIIEKENSLYYNKPMLSHYIAGFVGEMALFRYSHEWYDKYGIELNLGVEAERIDETRKKLVTTNGEFEYDALVLATGARAREPEVEGKEHLMTLRTFEDAKRIKESLESEDEPVIIGGGFIGLELASNLAKAGFKPRVVHRRATFLGLDEELSGILKEKLENAGVSFLLNANLMKADEKGILTDKGYIKSKTKICAIGIVPNKEIAEKSGIKTNRGVLIDERFQTSAGDVYAIGDCAEYEGIICGTAKTSMEHARTLANILRGKEALYDFNFRSIVFKFGDLPITIIGRVKNESRWVDENIKVFLENNMVVGAVVLEDLKEAMRLEKLIKNGLSLKEFG